MRLAACVVLLGASAAFLRRLAVEDASHPHPGSRVAGELRFKRLQAKKERLQAKQQNLENWGAPEVSAVNTSGHVLYPAPADGVVDVKPVTSVWVVGWGRAGTTLAMDMLGAGTSHVFTLFEPCHIGGDDVYRGETINAHNVQHLCPQLLTDVLRCDFSRLGGMRHLKLNAKHNNGEVPESVFSPEALASQCRTATMRIVKTVHIDENVMTTAGMGTVLQAVPHLKVMSVVRDPRAVYSSREQCHLSWHKSWVNTHPALFDRMCSQLEDAYYWPVHYPGRVRTLRYETLVSSPKEESTRMLQFLGLPVGTPRVKLWLREHMGAESCKAEDADEYGTCRTPEEQKAALTKWRGLLGEVDKHHADVVCTRVLHSFGYAP